MQPTIFLVAGEASGDVLGARLMVALATLRPGLRFAGIGGPHMAEQGLSSLFPMRELAVMGLVEVLPKIRALSRRLRQTADEIARTRPDLVVTIDSPGFTLRLLRRIALLGIPRVHYVAPQVWAWREHRVREFPGLWERLLCLLPFETAFFAQHGLEARFTGHPVLQSGADHGDGAAFRARHGIALNAPVVMLMPGSRRSEAPRLLPVFGATVRRLARTHPDLAVVVAASPVVSATVLRMSRRWPVAPIIVTETRDKHDAFAASGAALTKSGTSTLELALAGVPMAVTYRVNPLTAAIARRLIRVKHVAMVNLLAGRTLVPELLQQDCRPTRLAATLAHLLDDNAAASTQRAGFRDVLNRLRPETGTPAEAAAREILAVLDRP
ncbi:lipid-A-disaccharide synthase [Lichenicoccus sp.]|uniref:lipid-A-disaccharide synthase n=1 Tax=Lichenicoccus sp. TaxID=2781899 RepID=UPI003D147B69